MPAATTMGHRQQCPPTTPIPPRQALLRGAPKMTSVKRYESQRRRTTIMVRVFGGASLEGKLNGARSSPGSSGPVSQAHRAGQSRTTNRARDMIVEACSMRRPGKCQALARNSATEENGPFLPRSNFEAGPFNWKASDTAESVIRESAVLIPDRNRWRAGSRDGALDNLCQSSTQEIIDQGMERPIPRHNGLHLARRGMVETFPTQRRERQNGAAFCAFEGSADPPEALGYRPGGTASKARQARWQVCSREVTASLYT